MFITQNDILSMRVKAGRPMSDGEILQDVLQDWKNGREYKLAEVAERYYKGLHDVFQHDFQKEMISETVEDEQTGARSEAISAFKNFNRSNYRAANPFFREQINQKASYLLGKEPSISVDGSDSSTDLAFYHDRLAETTDAHFTRAIKRWAMKASIDGRAFLHEYKDADGYLKQTVVGLQNAVPIYDEEFDEHLQELIYFYDTQVKEASDRYRTVTHAEWWTAAGVTYWIKDGNNAFMPDPERPGLQPHYWTVTMVSAPDGLSLIEKSREPMTFDRFPWIELRNNVDADGDLMGLKELIDAYDLVQCAGTNNILDFNEFFAIIQGFGGEDASSVVRKLRINRAVNVGSAAHNGNIELKQLDLAMQGRIDWLKVLRDAIYEFGMAVDVKSVENLGGAPSGTSLKFQYTLLDLKAENMISEMRPAMADHFWFVTEEINKRFGTEYDSDIISVDFNKSMIVNDSDIVAIINNSLDIVPERILLAHHPFVTDPDEAMAELEEQRKRKLQQSQLAFGGYGKGADEEEEEDDQK